MSQEPKKTSGDPQTQIQFKEEYLKHELQKIDRMTIQDLLKLRRRGDSGLDLTSQPDSLNQQVDNFNQQYKVENKYIGQRTPGELWVGMREQVKDMRAVDFQQQLRSKTLNYAKRGKLGIDLFLIGFATFGMIGIPLYFYLSGKRDRERKVRNKKLTPSQIRALDQDSKINIDDVSEQVIMYYNPERERMKLQQMQMVEQHERIMRQIEEM